MGGENPPTKRKDTHYGKPNQNRLARLLSNDSGQIRPRPRHDRSPRQSTRTCGKVGEKITKNLLTNKAKFDKMII